MKDRDSKLDRSSYHLLLLAENERLQEPAQARFSGAVGWFLTITHASTMTSWRRIQTG